MFQLEKTLESNCLKWKDKEHIFDKVNGVYRGITYGDFLTRTRSLASYLISLGFKNKSVMIYGKNSSEYMMADLAVLQYVGISVCISKEWKEMQIMQAIELLDIACVLYDEEKEEMIRNVAEACPSVMFVSFHKALENTMESEKISLEETDPDTCCKIVFSSGTTAAPKAVMLSKRNIFAGLDSLYRRCPFDENDVDFLVLPLSHTYAGIYNFLYSLVFGFSIYICSDISVIAQEILEANPTVFCGVPLIYKRLYEGYGSNLSKAFGSRIKYLFCGGVLMEESLRLEYKNAGLDIMDAYALTETASTFAIQYPNDPDTKTAGTIAEEVDVKIIDRNADGVGEVVIKGENVFLGYAGNPELTQSVFTEDGYFKTGDLGYMKPDERHGGNKLYIVGRIKKILIGENGENIDPGHLERLICEKDPDIGKAQLFIKNGKLSCRVFYKGMTNSPMQQKDWNAFFEAINKEVPAYERIREFDVVEDSRWKQ